MVKSVYSLSPLAHQWLADSPLRTREDAYFCYLNERGYAAGIVTGCAFRALVEYTGSRF